MTRVRFGLITRIALLVVAIEVSAFSLLGWFYIDRFSTAAEERLRARLGLVGRMIADNELVVGSVAMPELMSDLVGAPYVRGVVVGGSGRVIVSSDPTLLGRPAQSVPGLDPAWLADGAPAERVVPAGQTLTGILQVRGEGIATPVYVVALTIGTRELDDQKRSIALWGWLVSAAFVLVTSTALLAVTERLVTRRVDRSLRVLKVVEGGDLDARIPVPAHDELGQMQLGVNSMIAKLGLLLGQHRRNEEEMAAILDSIADGVIAVGADGGLLRCNPSAAAILGEQELAGNHHRIDRLLPELGLGHEWWRAEQSLTAGERFHIERRTADGDSRFIEVGHGPIRGGADGRSSGAVLVLQDVTERRHAEQRLHDAVERLTESNTELERFAYVASHDLQEPLRTITSFSQLVERRVGPRLDSYDRENLAFIVTAAKRMSTLITDLLEYSRVSSRGIAFQPVQLRQACLIAVENLQDSIGASDARVDVGDLPQVLADGSQMTQVFQNLIGNAIKFRHPERPPHIQVSAARSGDEWVITVRDNGIGIESTDQDIFEIFRRLHSSAAFPGSGVGLAICKRIVQRHLGRIWFDAGGDGTAFHFSLPAEAAGS